jgi:hypothetical protein
MEAVGSDRTVIMAHGDVGPMRLLFAPRPDPSRPALGYRSPGRHLHPQPSRRPTLILHRQNHGFIPIEHARYLAEHLPRAKLVELPGADALLMWETPELARRLVGEADGQVVKTTGDGVLATFDGPGRGIGCTRRLRGGAHQDRPAGARGAAHRRGRVARQRRRRHRRAHCGAGDGGGGPTWRDSLVQDRAGPGRWLRRCPGEPRVAVLEGRRREMATLRGGGALTYSLPQRQGARQDEW